MDATATNKLFERAARAAEMATTTLEQDLEILARPEAAAELGQMYTKRKVLAVRFRARKR
jgi:hypothetical protein